MKSYWYFTEIYIPFVYNTITSIYFIVLNIPIMSKIFRKTCENICSHKMSAKLDCFKTNGKKLNKLKPK